jgi:hypothetical protein
LTNYISVHTFITFQTRSTAGQWLVATRNALITETDS